MWQRKSGSKDFGFRCFPSLLSKMPCDKDRAGSLPSGMQKGAAECPKNILYTRTHKGALVGLAWGLLCQQPLSKYVILSLLYSGKTKGKRLEDVGVFSICCQSRASTSSFVISTMEGQLPRQLKATADLHKQRIPAKSVRSTWSGNSSSLGFWPNRSSTSKLTSVSKCSLLMAPDS